MIYDGLRGYVKGSMDEPANTVLAMTKGPIKGRNWNYAATNPSYSITITSGATGAVKLQGTNDVAYRSGSGGELNPTDMDMLPAEGATWTDIATTGISASGTIAVEYQFLRLIVSTQGTGTILQAWVRWS